jgi:hypothetical protein
MQFLNEHYKESILPEIKNYVEFLQNIINLWKVDDFEKEFNEIKNYIWQDFLNMALETTNVIDIEVKKVIK